MRTANILVNEVEYEPGEAQDRHAHPYANVTLVLDGTIQERVGSNEACGRPLSLVIKPAGVEHANTVGRRGARTLQVALLDGIPDECGCVQFRWRWLHGGPAVRPLVAMLMALRSADAGCAGTVENAVPELFSILADDVGRESPAAAPLWLRDVRTEIDDSAVAAPSVAALARSAGVHRVHLARMFRRFYGCSVSGYMLAHRVRAAARLLAEEDASLTHVSLAAGFADQSHLCRVFKTATGMTPAAWRRVAGRRS